MDIIKCLRDSIPQGEHPNPHGEWIQVRLDVVIAAAEAIEAFEDDKDWLEKGIAEWRSVALKAQEEIVRLEATNRVVTWHLNRVLNCCRSDKEQQEADTSARDWLLSIAYSD